MPNHKKPITRHLHQYKQMFDSITALKKIITKELCGNIGSEVKVDVGYFHGRQSAKIWLISNADLQHMYSVVKGEISMWAECSVEESSSDESEDEIPVKKKRSTRRQALEEEVQRIYQKLFSKHGDAGVYDGPKLRLWAHMIQNGSHHDYDDPPRVPQITGIKERPKKESLVDAVTGAAMAVAKVFAPASTASEAQSPSASENEHQTVNKSVLSPSTCTGLRMKNLEQLKYLQQLLAEGVLSETEYTEQKNIILDTLRNLK